MRAAAADPEARDTAPKEAAERSAFREGEDDDRKPKHAAEALEGTLRALVAAAVEAAAAVEKVVAVVMIGGGKE